MKPYNDTTYRNASGSRSITYRHHDDITLPEPVIMFATVDGDRVASPLCAAGSPEMDRWLDTGDTMTVAERAACDAERAAIKATTAERWAKCQAMTS